MIDRTIIFKLLYGIETVSQEFPWTLLGEKVVIDTEDMSQRFLGGCGRGFDLIWSPDEGRASPTTI